MIKKTLTATLILIASFSGYAQPKGAGSFEKEYVVKSFLKKTPSFILLSFGKKLDFKEEDKVGLPRWTYTLDKEGKEELLNYKLNLIDKKWFLEGRRVFSFEADFYRPAGSRGEYICWDAFYLLLPKGVDYEKENEKYK